ncbi:MAG: hypothetical protein ABW211_00825, partial [Acidimicrobiia bacterium]
FGLYLLLATSGDTVAALDAADGWGNDAMVTFTRGDTTCIRVNFVGATPAASSNLHDALNGWAALRPKSATVTVNGDTTTLASCDPGAAAVDPGNAPMTALTAATVRNGLLSEAIGALGEKTASCVVDKVVRDPAFGPVLAAAVDNPSAQPAADVFQPFQASVASSVASCSRT